MPFTVNGLTCFLFGGGGGCVVFPYCTVPYYLCTAHLFAVCLCCKCHWLDHPPTQDILSSTYHILMKTETAYCVCLLVHTYTATLVTPWYKTAGDPVAAIVLWMLWPFLTNIPFGMLPADFARLAGRKVFCTPVCINAPYQFISLLNSCPLIFGLMSYGWFTWVYLCLFISWEYHFWFTPTFSQTKLGHKTRILK
jgi:hypothetical protein